MSCAACVHGPPSWGVRCSHWPCGLCLKCRVWGLCLRHPLSKWHQTKHKGKEKGKKDFPALHFHELDHTIRGLLWAGLPFSIRSFKVKTSLSRGLPQNLSTIPVHPTHPSLPLHWWGPWVNVSFPSGASKLGRAEEPLVQGKQSQLAGTWFPGQRSGPSSSGRSSESKLLD